MKHLRVAIGCDHAAFDLKQAVMKIQEFGQVHVTWQDMGTLTPERVDYPDIAKKVSQEVLDQQAEFGILLCGTGIGMCITANRFKGIRAAEIFSDETAALVREHNDANVACFGGRIHKEEEVHRWLEIFFNTDFEGGRHERRIKKMDE